MLFCGCISLLASVGGGLVLHYWLLRRLPRSCGQLSSHITSIMVIFIRFSKCVFCLVVDFLV